MDRFFTKEKAKEAAVLFVQITGLTMLYKASAWMVAYFHIPIPATVLGMIVLIVLLASGVLPVRWVEKGARLLVQHLALFFVPIAVGLMTYGNFIRSSGFALLTIIAGSSLIGLIVTAFVYEQCSKEKRKRA